MGLESLTWPADRRLRILGIYINIHEYLMDHLKTKYNNI